MNTNIKIFLLCPVPEEQKPINTYIGLKENPLTSWTTLSKKNFEKKLFSFSFYFLAIVSLFSVGSLEDSNYFFCHSILVTKNLENSFSVLYKSLEKFP